jgi:hypothetical protein
MFGVIGLTWTLLWSFFGVGQWTYTVHQSPVHVIHTTHKVVQPRQDGRVIPLNNPQDYGKQGGTGRYNGVLIPVNRQVCVLMGGYRAETGYAEAVSNHLDIVSCGG